MYDTEDLRCEGRDTEDLGTSEGGDDSTEDLDDVDTDTEVVGLMEVGTGDFDTEDEDDGDTVDMDDTTSDTVDLGTTEVDTVEESELLEVSKEEEFSVSDWVLVVSNSSDFSVSWDSVLSNPSSVSERFVLDTTSDSVLSSSDFFLSDSVS